jgi:hypothetical protein
MTDSPLRRAGRSLIQLIAGGGLTALVAVVADGLSATWAGVLVMGSSVLVAWAQNFAEDAGWIPPVLGTKTDTPAQ